MNRRRSLGALLLLSAVVPARARADAPLPKMPPLQVSIDRAKVDLVKHSVEVKLSRVAERVTLKVIGQSGSVLDDVDKSFTGAAAGTPLVVTWTPASDETVAKIEVWGYDAEGYYAGIAIIPWSVSVPHEEVNFETDSDVIRPSEVPKLEASLQQIVDVVTKYRELGKITLFVVGHTDTVGTADHNLTLSRKRARAIAAWFKGHALGTAIAYEGTGKAGLLVKTADQIDEPRNRRVDYILALEPPRLGGDLAWKTP